MVVQVSRRSRIQGNPSLKDPGAKKEVSAGEADPEYLTLGLVGD